MEMIKNFIASAFFVPAIICNYIAKPFVFLATRFSLVAIYLHEKFETKIGKVISQQKTMVYAQALKAEAMRIMQQQQGQQDAADQAKLANIIANGSVDKSTNVFVLGKKKQEDK